MNRPSNPAVNMRDGAARVPMLEPARLDELVGLLGRPRFNDLLDLLIDDCRDRPDRIRDCQARGDLAGLRAEAARLSRAAATIGAAPLGDAAAALVGARDAALALPLVDALDEAAHATLCVARHLCGARFAPAARA